MTGDAELMVLFGALHLLGLALAELLLFMFFRSETVTGWSPPRSDDDDDGGGGGGNDPREPLPPTLPPSGGLPLPDARPARVRLREPVRLADLLPPPARRPVREPRPERVPARHVHR